MQNKNPPFEITNDILALTTEIAELSGRLEGGRMLSQNPVLRRLGRIRTIYGSLAIEQNTLTLEQVTALLNGKRVLAPPKDIAEAKNAYEIYERLPELDPYSVSDLLTAHGVMMRGLVEEGAFRTTSVGVVDEEGKILHFGTLPAYVPGAVAALLSWAEQSPFPMPITSGVLHYELELIHPFRDGNGRIGRLWHTLMLSKWNPLFAWLPVESVIHGRQKEYYDAINRSNEEGMSTCFLRFILSAIKEALLEVVPAEEGPFLSSEENRFMVLRSYLGSHKTVKNAEVRALFGVSSATAGRLLSGYTRAGRLERFREGRTWAYRLP